MGWLLRLLDDDDGSLSKPSSVGLYSTTIIFHYKSCSRNVLRFPQVPDSETRPTFFLKTLEVVS